MSKKINVFYVWGYGSSPESHTVKDLQDLLGDDYNVVSDYYAQYNPEEAINDIKYHIQEKKIDILVGSSLGGYIAMQIPHIKKVIINPCICPLYELPLLTDEAGEPCVPPHIVDFYFNWDNKHNVWETFNNSETVFIMGEDDEVFGTKYIEEVKEHSTKVNVVKQGHQNTRESVEQFVVPVIKKI